MLSLRKDGFKADLTAYKVFIDGVETDMAPKEYDLLFFLIRNKNIAVPREKIMAEVWGFDYCGDDRTLDTHMKLLRKSLGPYAHFIKTLRDWGIDLMDKLKLQWKIFMGFSWAFVFCLLAILWIFQTVF
jgi:DNA-binding response OmpR family regulator